MAEVVWSPAPGVLFEEPETARGLSFHISCSVVVDPVALEPAPTVTGYRAALTPEPGAPVLQVSVSASGINVTSAALAGLFGIEFIDYWIDGRVVQVKRWEDLPEAAQEVVEFRPSRTSQKTYTLSAAALLSDGTESRAGYQCTIQQDWTAGRDRLRREVDARRNPPRR